MSAPADPPAPPGADWTTRVKPGALAFLEGAYRGGGYFAYAPGADLYGPEDGWGLNNAVFAVKTYGILGHLDALPEDVRGDVRSFIAGFEGRGGVFRDPLLRRRTALWNALRAVRRRRFGNVFGRETARAESRQATVALTLIGGRPAGPFLGVPYARKAIGAYLDRLDWRDIWGAASHVNHLVFFLHSNASLFDHRADEAREGIGHCLERLDRLQDPRDGMWTAGRASAREKVNAAMKVVSAFNVAARPEIPHAERVVDFILDSDGAHRRDGCDNLNAMHVLRYCLDRLGGGYRRGDVETFCTASLEIYRRAYLRDPPGGFSFVPDDAPRTFYGMTVTRRHRGPDVHGTMLFTWAVALATRLLGLRTQDFRDIPN